MSIYLSPLEPIVRFGTLLKIQMTEDKGVREKNLLVSKEFDHGEMLRRIHEEGIYKSEEVMQRLIELLIDEKYAFDIEVGYLDLGEKGRVSEAQQWAKRTELNQQTKVVDGAVAVLKRSTYVTAVPEGTLCVMDTSIGPTLGVVKIILKGLCGLERIFTVDVLGPPTTEFPSNFSELLERHYRHILQQFYPDEYLTLTVLVTRSDLAEAEDCLIEKIVRYN